MKQVTVPTLRVEAYAPLAGEAVVERIRALARPLVGLRVAHVNATAYGGGVVELLFPLVGLLNGVGIPTDWWVMEGTDAFFRVTKTAHNGLQGADVVIDGPMQETYREVNVANSRFDWDAYDVVVIHDPQPAALASLVEHRRGRWIWRCHIDLSRPNPGVWSWIRPYLTAYDGAIFSLAPYVQPDLSLPLVAIIPPSIDPLSEKNRDLDPAEVEAIVRRFGMDPRRPLVAQVSRFDPWKDPLGVVDAYRLVKREMPEVQLLLVGSMATDDPEGWTFYDRTLRHAGEDPDLFILANLHGINHREVNAFQRAADVIIQKSLREGFGLTVTEGLWKGRPVVGGNAGGIPIQVLDGQNGFLVESVEQCADRTQWLLQNPAERARMGGEGREHVRRHFLVTRDLEDHLQLLARLMAAPAAVEARTGLFVAN
ncbi:glycosyltransferase [Limnochorda pilosa]|uniref:Trehalose synthase n=1 Tax=Limnochorda pilosa TaxID=1555112 RepID=A0A0K2SQN7_LIMPI|nr:glycosyltransferase [Limnochorda pilosa]BAS29129.1 trehalose synthase [Limnochorda pilosa]